MEPKYKIGQYLVDTGLFAENTIYKIVGITDTKHYRVKTIKTNWICSEPYHYVDCPMYYLPIPRNKGVMAELLFSESIKAD